MRYPEVLSEDETLDRILARRSVARYGDGELKICRGRNAKSQQAEKGLADYLCRALKDPGPCLVSIPRIDKTGPKYAFWRQYAVPPYTWLYEPSQIYGSSLITRPDSAPHINTPAYWMKVRRIWRDERVVLVRGSEKSLVGDRLDKAREVEEIVLGNRDAFVHFADLYHRLKRERRPVILCLGATATALAWVLAQEGVWALDLGHVGMFMKRIGDDGIVPARDIGSKE